MKRSVKVQHLELNNIKTVFIKVNLLIINDQVMVSFTIEQIEYMKDNGLMIIGTGEALKDIVMETNMKVSLKIINLMEKEFIPG
jgi:hypothetical protein